MVLDERFLRDGTVVLCNWELYDERKDPNSEDDRDEAFWHREGWLDVRLPGEKAARIVVALVKLTVVCSLFLPSFEIFFCFVLFGVFGWGEGAAGGLVPEEGGGRDLHGFLTDFGWPFRRMR